MRIASIHFRRAVLIGLSILAAFSAFVLAFEYRLSAIEPYDFSEDAGRVWAHRATWGDSPTLQNTIEAARRSIEKGFPGVELDVYYSKRLGFVVKHSLPFSDSTPRLEEFFREFGPRLYYWLDFKNLLNGNAIEAAREIGRLTAKYGVREKIIVESLHEEPLAAFRDELGDVKVLYWIGEFPDGIRWLGRRLYYRAIVSWYGFRAVSISVGFTGASFDEAFGHLTRCTFTVNDRPEIAELTEKGFQIILTDLESFPLSSSP